MGFLDLAGESGPSRGNIGLLKQEISIESHFVFPSLRAHLDDVCVCMPVHALTHLPVPVSWGKGANSLAAPGVLGAR